MFEAVSVTLPPAVTGLGLAVNEPTCGSDGRNRTRKSTGRPCFRPADDNCRPCGSSATVCERRVAAFSWVSTSASPSRPCNTAVYRPAGRSGVVAVERVMAKLRTPEAVG